MHSQHPKPISPSRYNINPNGDIETIMGEITGLDFEFYN